MSTKEPEIIADLVWMEKCQPRGLLVIYDSWLCTKKASNLVSAEIRLISVCLTISCVSFVLVFAWTWRFSAETRSEYPSIKNANWEIKTIVWVGNVAPELTLLQRIGSFLWWAKKLKRLSAERDHESDSQLFISQKRIVFLLKIPNPALTWAQTKWCIKGSSLMA